MSKIPQECWNTCFWLNKWTTDHDLSKTDALRQIGVLGVDIDASGHYCPTPGPAVDPLSQRKICHARIGGVMLGPEQPSPN